MNMLQFFPHANALERSESALRDKKFPLTCPEKFIKNQFVHDPNKGFFMVNPIRAKLESEECLNLLREISVDPRLTQRKMSSRLNLSLGKINFLIKAMIEKGLVKVENFRNSENKAAYLYSLTPAGIDEKAEITLRFLKRKTEEYERIKREIRRLENDAVAVDSYSDSCDGFFPS